MRIVVLEGANVTYDQYAIQFIPGTHKEIYDFLIRCGNVFSVKASADKISIQFYDIKNATIYPWDWILLHSGGTSVMLTQSDEYINAFYKVKDA